MNTLKISKSSWHYWLFKKVNEHNEPTNLCSYMRNVLGAIALFTVFGAFMVAIASSILSYYVIVICVAVGIQPPGDVGLLIVSIAFNVLIFSTILLSVFNDYVKPYCYEHDIPTEVDIQPPAFMSLIWSYIKAGKQKICPLVEAIDRNS